MTTPELLTIAADAYCQESGGICLLPSLPRARRHSNGDTLGDFIVIELHEVLRHTPAAQRPSIATNALRSAQRQLEAIIMALAPRVTQSGGQARSHAEPEDPSL
jgi:hypothetical protein